MQREEVVFNDILTVKTTDGTWNKESLILNPWYNGPENRDSDSEFWTRQKKCAEAVLAAYKNGTLEKAGFCVEKPKVTNGSGCIGFAVCAKDIPDELWAILEEYGQKDPCNYSGCFPAVNMQMLTYRSTGGEYGCVGRSWETTLLIHLDTESCHQIMSIRQKLGVYAAALATLKIYEAPGVEAEIEKIEGLKKLTEEMV